MSHITADVSTQQRSGQYRNNPYSWNAAQSFTTAPVPPEEYSYSPVPQPDALAQLVCETRQQLLDMQRWCHSFESASCVRLQCAVKKIHAALYNSVVNGLFSGRWHKFCVSAGLFVFTYEKQDFAEYLSIAEFIPFSELRVSFAPKSVAAKYDSDLGCRFPAFKAQILNYCGFYGYSQKHFSKTVDEICSGIVRDIPFARNLSKILLKRLVAEGLRQATAPFMGGSSSSSGLRDSTYSTRVLDFSDIPNLEEVRYRLASRYIPGENVTYG